MQTLRRSREPVLVRRRVLVSTTLAAASPQQKVAIFGRRTSGACGGHKEGPQGRNGPNPLVLLQRGTIISPLMSAVVKA